MKYIKKNNPPEEYLNWCDTQRKLGANYNYKSLPNPEKEILHKSLIIEQGYICAYTMKRIELNSSHIEHIKPRHVCVQEGAGVDLDYKNLLSCFPRKGMVRACRYGAQAKDKWWENKGQEFLSPLNEFCELRVVFYLDGTIIPTNIQTISTEKTISVLKLDEPTLIEERKRSIEEFIYGGGPLTPSDAVIAINNIYLPDSGDRFPVFCIAIHDALHEYVDLLNKLN